MTSTLYEGAKVAENYAKFRPNYPQELVDRIMEFHFQGQESKRLELMVDVGCGTGQSTVIFHPYFERIIGMDISSEQLKHARENNSFNNIEFIEGSEKSFPVQDRSVDVVVSGAAAHWLNLSTFFNEIRRVLKPTGSVAIFGYWTPEFISILNPKSQSSKWPSEKFEEVILESVAHNPFKTKAYKKLQNRYQDIFDLAPFKNKKRIEGIHLIKECSIKDLRGYMMSSDSYQPYIDKKVHDLKMSGSVITKETIDSVDYVKKFIKEFKANWGVDNFPDEEPFMKLDYNYFLLLFKK